jgi:hypothetical protein
MRERCQQQREPIGEAAARLVAGRAKQGFRRGSFDSGALGRSLISSASICFQN